MRALKSALRTYNSALYAYRATKAVIGGLRKTSSSPRTTVVQKIRQRTRGALANNPRAYDRGTLSGQKRRDDLAKALRAKPRPVRSKTGSTIPRKIPRTPPSGKIVLERGMSGRRLRNRVRTHLRREQFIKPLLKYNKGDRKATADHIRAHRAAGIKPKFTPNYMNPTLKKAVRNYRKAFGG